MFVSTLATNTTESEANLFTIEPVTGEFTAGQTVTATASGGFIFPVPLQLELWDEENSQALVTTSAQLDDGLRLFNLIVPSTLR